MDPQQQQQLAGMAASMGIAVLFFGLLVYVFLIFLFWRILTKAGLAGALSLLTLIPGIGPLIVLCILAFSTWPVVRASSGYSAGVPAYPPPAYPTANYPPSSPPAL